MLRKGRVVVFLLWTILVGIAFGVMQLLFWFLEDLNQGDSCEETQSLKILQGFCMTTNCIGEIPMFFLSGRIMERLGGGGSMVFVLVAHGVRLMYYSTLINPWQALPIELMQAGVHKVPCPPQGLKVPCPPPPGVYKVPCPLPRGLESSLSPPPRGI